ncbi:MAG: hypothetical protein F2590_02585 [Actinobacteria bacterium]|uniref:Unannotated protein n=1 Tax=freshwater metagenome TaxID=449393 RepID=A0A6J6HID1_9ZZZZ|nr:hypothetical protein [Actinomycetota bacterium]
MDNLLSWYQLEPGLAANFHLTEGGEFFGSNRSSRDISNAVDLNHLKKLRSQADAIVVGGSTARAEGYKPSENFKTYVFSHRLQGAGLHQLEFSNDDQLSEQLSNLKELHQRILCECGPSLLNKFLSLQRIDQLFLTVTFGETTNADTAEQIANRVLRLDGYRLDRYEAVESSALTLWRRA